MHVKQTTKKLDVSLSINEFTIKGTIGDIAAMNTTGNNTLIM